MPETGRQKPPTQPGTVLGVTKPTNREEAADASAGLGASDHVHAADRIGDPGHRAAVTFPTGLEVPATARRYTRGHLTRWAVPRTLCDTADHIVTELVTNSVQHTRSEWVRLIVTITSGRAVLTVMDDGRYRKLAPKKATEGDEGGRGLALVAALADEWGHYEHCGRLAVYAALRLPDAPGAAC